MMLINYALIMYTAQPMHWLAAFCVRPVQANRLSVHRSFA